MSCLGCRCAVRAVCAVKVCRWRRDTTKYSDPVSTILQCNSNNGRDRGMSRLQPLAHMIVIIQLSIDGISYEIQIVLTCRVTFTLQHMIEYELFQNFCKNCQHLIL